MMMADIATAFPAIKILRDEPLAHYTHTKTGVPPTTWPFQQMSRRPSHC